MGHGISLGAVPSSLEWWLSCQVYFTSVWQKGLSRAGEVSRNLTCMKDITLHSHSLDLIDSYDLPLSLIPINI